LPPRSLLKKSPRERPRAFCGARTRNNCLIERASTLVRRQVAVRKRVFNELLATDVATRAAWSDYERRHSAMVQLFEGLRIHHAGRRGRGCVCALLQLPRGKSAISSSESARALSPERGAEGAGGERDRGLGGMRPGHLPRTTEVEDTAALTAVRAQGAAAHAKPQTAGSL